MLTKDDVSKEIKRYTRYKNIGIVLSIVSGFSSGITAVSHILHLINLGTLIPKLSVFTIFSISLLIISLKIIKYAEKEITRLNYIDYSHSVNQCPNINTLKK